MTTHVTKDARRGAATLVCRVSRRQRARAVASLNLKKRETALSLTFHRTIYKNSNFFSRLDGPRTKRGTSISPTSPCSQAQLRRRASAVPN